jgi:L-malate glycosyltransferase
MKKKDKIIFVHFFNSFSGSPRVLESVIGVFRHKYDCELITNDTNGFLDNVDVPKKKFVFKLSKNRIITLFSYLLGQIKVFFLVLESCTKGDLVYINTTIPVLGALAAKLRGAYVLFHLHEDTESLNFVHRAFAYFRRFVCDFEIFVSSYLCERGHIPTKEFCVIHNSLSEEFLVDAQKGKAGYQVGSKNFIVLMVCSLKHYKGLLQFLEIANLLQTRPEFTFRLVVDADQEMVDYFFADIKVPRSVEIHTSTLKVSKHYEDAALLVNLSLPDAWVETFGLTILEGMAYSLPCIVPEVGGPTEIVIDGENGFTVSAYECSKIADLIVNIYEDKELYSKLARNSAIKAKQFSYSAFEKNLLECISSIHPANKDKKTESFE